MKKTLILIIFALVLNLFCACGDGVRFSSPNVDGIEGSLGDGITSFTPQYQQVISKMDYSKNSITKIQVNVTGGVQRSYFVQTIIDNGEYSLTVADGKTETFEAQGSFISAKNFFKDAYTDGGFDGYAKHLIFTPISSLIKLNEQTVRAYRSNDEDGNFTVYTLELYEGMVKSALPLLAEEFELLEDVKNLQLEVSVGGTVSQVKVNINALYKDVEGDCFISVSIEYQELLRVVE